MTAAFTPAPQITFAPRTLTLVPEPASAVEPRSITPVDEPAAGAAPLATVHKLPVRSSAAVYRRRRLGVLAILLGAVLGVVSFVSGADATPTPEGQLAESITIVVQPGDTLWGIASALAPDDDPRQLVDDLEALAGGTVLQPGQQIVVPAHLVAG